MPDRRERHDTEPAPRRPDAGPGLARGTDRRVWLLALPPALLAAVAFLPALGNALVAWDDSSNFVNNRQFRGLGWEQIRWDWTTLHMGVYQPLGWMLLSAQYLAGGLEPRGYHLTSLLLHAANAVALYALVIALLARCRPEQDGGSPWGLHIATGLAVALFMVHPLRTEVVAWVSCQPYLPCALFSSLAVLAYLHAHPSGRPTRVGWVVGSWLLFAAALLSKAAAIGLPAVLLILDLYPLRRLGPRRWGGSSAWRTLAEKLPFAALSLVFVGVALRAREHIVIPPRIQPGGIGARLAQACYGACFYPLKTAFPVDLVAYYPLPDRVVWSDPRFALSGALVGGVSLILVLLRRRWPGLLAAWACYLVLLAPASGLTRNGASLVADRYSYIPMMGAVALLAAVMAAPTGPGRWRRRAAIGVAVVGVVLLPGLVALSWRQCQTWRNTSTLWRHALAHTASPPPEMSMYLGAALAASEGWEAALPHLTRAVQIAPDYPEARYDLGCGLFNLSRLDKATEQFVAAIRLKSDYAEAHAMLGRTLFRQGRPDEAADHFRRAVQLRPDNAEARYYLGVSLLQQRRLDEADAQLSEAIRLKPDHEDAICDLGALRAEQGRLDEAKARFAQALQLKPDHADAHYNTGLLLAREGRLTEAEAHFARALESRPHHASARRALDAIRQLGGRSIR